MVAPSIIGQFPGTLEQIAEALKLLGFDKMEEVAFGAETTTRNETKEFIERMEKGNHIMTTSCCPAYVETVKKHVPEMLPFVSDTLSPMKYTAIEVKKENPDAITVFIGPCVAKIKEAQSDSTDYVLTFEELGALVVAYEIEIAELKGIDLQREVDGYARGFATSCGVSAAILNEERELQTKNNRKEDIPEIKSNFINGLTAKSVKQLRLYAQGKIPGNFLEVMACEGGCVGGPCAIGQVKLATQAVQKLAKK
jgi:iron only hydrogenase large subunit-like protein